MSSNGSTPFPLGVFVGNPNNSDASAEATFDASYRQFATIMGSQAQYMDAFVDASVPSSQWLSNAEWAAASFKASPTAKTMIPVIGLPMASSAAGSPTADQTFKNFAAGDYDSIIQGMVKSWTSSGFTTQYWRPGVEMNLSSSPGFVTSDSATQSDWIAAFQHIYTVLHAAGTADGVNVQVLWNPGITNYSDAGVATQTLYPGNQYVDVIAADVYSDVYPFGTTTALYDWDKSGQVIKSTHPVFDSSLGQWAGDPINLAHYYTYPASGQYSLDESQDHSLSLQNLIDLAKTEGKPLAIAETGAGNTADGAGLSDNPTFVQWLAATLAGSGVPVKFVNIWDSNGGGKYEFSDSSDDKPKEEAAWAHYFGAQTTSIMVTPVTRNVSLTDVAGSKVFSVVAITNADAGQTDTARVSLSSNANGALSDPNAATDGSKIASGVVTISGLPATVAAALDGLIFTPTAHQVAPGKAVTTTVSADITDTAGQTASTSATVVATAVGAPLTVTPASRNVSATDTSGVKAFSNIIISDANAGQTETASITLSSSSNGTLSDPNAAADGSKIANDGLTISGSPSAVATALNGVVFTPAPHEIAPGKAISTTVTAAITDTAGKTASTAATVTATAAATSTPDTLSINVSEDAWQGDAQFLVKVDGSQVGGTEAASALHSSGDADVVQLTGDWGQGSHNVQLQFLNDAYGGSATTDRNLYVNSIALDGTNYSGTTAALLGDSTDSFAVGGSTKVAASPADTLSLHLSGDDYQGDPAFTLFIDGKAVSTVQKVTALHSAGAWQNFLFSGKLGAGTHSIGVQYGNDLYGGSSTTDRNLYINGIDVNGHHYGTGVQELTGNGTASFSVVTTS
jgi:hypothetical protein